MQVYFNNFQLTGDDPKEWVSAYQAQTSNDVEVSKTFRGDFSKVFDRGNRVTSISFVVGRSHDSFADAFDYATMFGRQIPRTGSTGIVKIVMGVGDKTTTKRLFNGAVEVVGTTEVIGIYTIASFKLTLGEEITTK